MSAAPKCRWCDSETDAEFVDVGIGYVQVTGGQCACGAYEMGPFQNDGRITEEEFASAWLGPVEDHPDFSPFNHMREGDAP